MAGVVSAVSHRGALRERVCVCVRGEGVGGALLHCCANEACLYVEAQSVCDDGPHHGAGYAYVSKACV